MGKQMEKMRGQISTEILILIGLVLVLLVPLLIYAYGKANTATNDLNVQKGEFDVQRLASLSDSVGYLGGGAAITDEIEVPSNIISLYVDPVNPHDIVMNLTSQTGSMQVVQTSVFAITTPPSTSEESLSKISTAGTYLIEVRALSNFTNATSPDTPQVEMSLK